VLTGLKWRIPPRWDKDSRPGSLFRQLYGSWRLRADPGEVWVCEGETDTVWCALSLEPLGVGVLGVVTAAYRPRPEEVELLRGRVVILVFDADDAGGRARERWDLALSDVADEVRTVLLPPGKDLCQMSITPAQLRERLA
jgi:DNA primase